VVTTPNPQIKDISYSHGIPLRSDRQFLILAQKMEFSKLQLRHLILLSTTLFLLPDVNLLYKLSTSLKTATISAVLQIS